MLRNLRPKDVRRLALLLLGVVVILILELVFGAVQEWFKNRPLQAGVFTGVVLSLVAYFGFDAVRANLDERRWAPLAQLAFMTMVYETTLVIDVALWLATGISPSNDAKPTPDAQKQLKKIPCARQAAQKSDFRPRRCSIRRLSS